MQNLHVSYFDIGHLLNCDESSTRKKLQPINLIKPLDKSVPYKLSGENQIRPFTITICLLARKANEPFIEHIVTFHEQSAQ